MWSLAEEEQQKALKALKEQHTGEMRALEARMAEENATRVAAAGEAPAAAEQSAVGRLKAAHAQELSSVRLEARQALREEHLTQVEKLVKEHESAIEKEREAAQSAKALLVSAEADGARVRRESMERSCFPSRRTVAPSIATCERRIAARRMQYWWRRSARRTRSALPAFRRSGSASIGRKACCVSGMPR